MSRTDPTLEIKSILKANKLANGLTDEQLHWLVLHVEEREALENETIIHENEVSEDIFIIKTGEVEIFKFDPGLHIEHHLALLGPGTVIGELAVIDRAPRSASARARKPTALYVLPLAKLRELTPKASFWGRLKNLAGVFQKEKAPLPVHVVLMENIAKYLSGRLRSTNEMAVEALRRELIQTKARAAMSNLIINTLVILSFYIFMSKLMETLKSLLVSTTLLNIPLMILLVFPLLLMIKNSGYPMSIYGLSLKNWQRDALQALFYTFPLLMAIVFYKVMLIATVPSFANRHVFDLTFDLTTGAEHVSGWVGAFLIVLYLLFVPVQEFLARGILQSSFEQLLTGHFKTLWAILLSNLLFSGMHSHVSLGLGLVVMVPGLFWGWLYAKQKTLVGVIVSHLIVGLWALFAVGLT